MHPGHMKRKQTVTENQTPHDLLSGPLSEGAYSSESIQMKTLCEPRPDQWRATARHETGERVTGGVHAWRFRNAQHVTGSRVTCKRSACTMPSDISEALLTISEHFASVRSLPFFRILLNTCMIFRTCFMFRRQAKTFR